MIKVKTLKQAAKYLTALVGILKDYSYPLVAMEVENNFVQYKTWNFCLDGYDVCVHLSEFYINESIIQNLQIFPKKLYCLPFHVNFKVAVAFLGTKELVSFTTMKEGHIVSCWTRLKKQSSNGSVSIKQSIPTQNYLGVEYGVLE
jgi:hypothetical protein